MSAQRGAEAFAGLERTSGQRPRAGERDLRPLPEQHVQPGVSHLEDDGEHLVAETAPGVTAPDHVV